MLGDKFRKCRLHTKGPDTLHVVLNHSLFFSLFSKNHFCSNSIYLGWNGFLHSDLGKLQSGAGHIGLGGLQIGQLGFVHDITCTLHN